MATGAPLLRRLLSSPYYRVALPTLRHFNFARSSAYDWAAYYLERMNVTVKGIVDVGAFDGAIALHLADMFPHAEIYSFEPTPATFAQLERAARRQPRIRPFRYAVSDRNGAAELNVNRSPGTNSLLAVQHSDEMTAILGAGGEMLERVACETIRLDDFLSQQPSFTCQLLKTDTQGFDLHVLRGARQALESTVRVVISEFRFFSPAYAGDSSLLATIDAALAEMGFHLVGIPSISPHPESRRAFEADGVWVRG